MSSAGWAAITALAALLGGFAGSWIEQSSRERELNIKMIELAIGLLKEDPKGPLKPAREWAVGVIDKYAKSEGDPLSEDALAALKSEKVDVFSTIGERAMRTIGTGPIGDVRRGPIGDPRSP
jgi:hypothetical protein